VPAVGGNIRYSLPKYFTVDFQWVSAFNLDIPSSDEPVSVKNLTLPSGRTVSVVGPCKWWGSIASDRIQTWKKGKRPRIVHPYEGISVDKSPLFTAEIEAEETGHFAIIIQVKNKEGYTFYKFILNESLEVNLHDIRIELPEGEAVAWAGFKEREDDQIRYSQPRCFTIDPKRVKTFEFEGLVLPSNDEFRRLESAFKANLANLDYEENVELRKEEIKNGRSILLSAPPNLTLLLGRRCNANCIMCPEGRNPDLDTIPEPIMRQIPDLYPFLDSMCFTGGEPTIFKSTKYLIDSVKDFPNIRVSIATNGSTIMTDNWLDIILNGNFKLIFSIDASCKKTYEKIRRNLSWEGLTKTLDYIHTQRAGPFPHILIKMFISICFHQPN
jgi:hypothetical protein